MNQLNCGCGERDKVGKKFNRSTKKEKNCHKCNSIWLEKRWNIFYYIKLCGQWKYAIKVVKNIFMYKFQLVSLFISRIDWQLSKHRCSHLCTYYLTDHLDVDLWASTIFTGKRKTFSRTPKSTYSQFSSNVSNVLGMVFAFIKLFPNLIKFHSVILDTYGYRKCLLNSLWSSQMVTILHQCFSFTT